MAFDFKKEYKEFYIPKDTFNKLGYKPKSTLIQRLV